MDLLYQIAKQNADNEPNHGVEFIYGQQAENENEDENEAGDEHNVDDDNDDHNDEDDDKRPVTI